MHTLGAAPLLATAWRVGWLPEIAGDKPEKRKFGRYTIGYFHIDIPEVRTGEGKLYAWS